MDALREELTIQQVILESLRGETFDGAEAERAETLKEIERLTALLRQPRQAEPEQNGAGGECDSDPEQGSCTEPPLSASLVTSIYSSNPTTFFLLYTAPFHYLILTAPLQGQQSTVVSPTPNRRQTSGFFTTPRKRQMDNGVWGSPASHSLPSRKREYDSTSLGIANGQVKSRRTTPTPGGDPFASQESPSNFRGVEIIDLTGDDVDYDSTCVAEQIKQEKRQDQETGDRHLALQLSSQESRPSPGRSSTPAANLAHTNAFAKLMASQRSNSRGPTANYQLTVPEVKDEGGPSPSMPGAYDTRWDDNISTPVPLPNLALRSSHYGSVPTTPQPLPLHYLQAGGSFSTGAMHQSFGPGAFPLAMESPFVLRSQTGLGQSPVRGFNPALSMPPGGLERTPSLPTAGGVSLLDTINHTSMFDYSSSMDADGSAFPDRLTNFLQDAFHDPRVTEKELDDLLQNIRPDMDIPERNRDGTPAGLKSALYPHQELALSWMKSMEAGTNKGGILADDMGLGKTISTLALMLARPAISRPKTNLIIGPLSLIRQWEEEISKKTKLSHRMSVFIYHNKKATTEDLLKYDVVLTTYGTIAAEYKRLDKFMEENADRNIDFNDRANGFKFPLLHPNKAEFYRVILDEAQCIKNKDTKTAKACHRLRTTYRWCLTGTPMMNGVLELFSLVHFLRIKPYCVWENFRQAFGVLFGRKGDPKSVAMSRLRALLKAIMLRRKKDSKLDGKPILKLPPKTEEIVHATLSADERGFYKQLEEKSQVEFSKYLREGSVGKNYSSILVLLLRMRQACCHPHLNLDVDDAVSFSDEEMITLVKTLEQNTVERIKAMEAFECPICFDAVPSPSFFIPCGHDSCNDCVTRLADNAATMNLQAGDESDRAKCPVCRTGFDPKKCFTYDAFRSVYMPEKIAKNSESDAEEDSSSDDDSGSEHGCDEDADSKGNLKGFVVDDDEFDDADYVKSDGASKAKKKKKQRKGKKKSADVKPSMLKSLRVEAGKNRVAYKRYMRYLRKTWMPAAKVTECMTLLKKIQETGEKTIVFSQWTLLLDLLQVAMHHDKFERKPERYDGSMSGEQRARVAKDFRDDRNVKVMLVSLRAGNAGLNLTAANNVIIMDPFWNPYIEMQAVDRAYRIGQQKEVKVYRILTQETVEDRIIALQERKKEIVEAALDETESMKIGRLNVNELKFLFNTRG
ncbi:Putative ATP-dependent helicase C23E6.02 [Tolypocladium paradoxum]|uniref:ATP-dependent helicase C23E6.02 n=1 Tax=Tolypocladium paradoxum TaxID=94208 RepID=A0A2S4KVM0_9HYPO|nr:Putative ATP-dependent helicase C23E6.02 [Tolypocladium paradoxum]